jgi:hypothetical protein
MNNQQETYRTLEPIRIFRDYAWSALLFKGLKYSPILKYNNFKLLKNNKDCYFNLNCKIPTLLYYIFNLMNSIIYFFNLVIKILKLFYSLFNNFFHLISLKFSSGTKYYSNETQNRVNPVRSSFTNIRTFSTLRSTKEKLKLDPYWVTGFTDAEGCFSVIIEMSSLLKWS